ncbi:MAG: hypothetical protein WKH64_13990 [Chloroflexia bacterium]
MSLPLGRLEPVDLASYWSHEAFGFTAWLAKEENLELLASTLGLEFELLGVEVFVGPCRADIVALDTVSNAKVIIENQLETTNHDHLGKTLVHAAGLGAGIVIWIARSFTENHRLALDFLNEAAAPTLRYYGVEMQLWRIGNSAPAPCSRWYRARTNTPNPSRRLSEISPRPSSCTGITGMSSRSTAFDREHRLIRRRGSLSTGTSSP